MDNTEIKRFNSQELLAWYREHARRLPWRETDDPYAVWVSEVMLQQTRVEAVIPYYLRWLEAFPTVQDLADAEEDRVLKLWEGLGYYSRARNLHQAARIVANELGGRLPRDPAALQELPGIGRYTAGAVASIAFQVPAPILDGNLRRVLTRFYHISEPIQTAAVEKLLWRIAEELVPEVAPGEFNQSLMELGALICTPRSPDCGACPLAAGCRARKQGNQESLPVRKAKTPPPHLQVAAAVIQHGDRFLLAKRPPDVLLGGLWEFPGGKQEAGETLAETLAREIQEELALKIEVGDLLGTYQHAYTHYSVTLHAFQCRQISEDLQLKYHTETAWVEPDELAAYPMGKLDRLIADSLGPDP